MLELSVGKKAVIGDSKRLFVEKEAIVAKAVMSVVTTHALPVHRRAELCVKSVEMP